MIEYFMTQDQLKPNFKPVPEGLEVEFITLEGQVAFRCLTDISCKSRIARLTWYMDKKHPIGQTGPNTKPIALHRYLAGATSGNECVIHRNGNRRDYRLSNLELITKSYVARTAMKRCERRGKGATAFKGVYQDPYGKYYSGHSYRFNSVESPRFDDIDKAALAQKYITWLLEPKMQAKSPEPQIPADLAAELRRVVLPRKQAIDAKLHPTPTPVPNIYLSAAWPNQSYEYAFTHHKIRYRKAGFKSIFGALRAYNQRVLEVTNDPTRFHRIPPDVAFSEIDRVSRLEELNILKDGKSVGPLGRQQAAKLMQELLKEQ